MEKVKNMIKDGLNYHLSCENKPENILIGDEIIFKTLFNDHLEIIQQYNELNEYAKSLIYEQLSSFKVDENLKDINYSGVDEIDKEIINIINTIDNEFIKKELLELNSGKKKMIRGKLALNTQKIKDYKIPALVELFHLSTLIQDDVIDKAKHRRFKKTISFKYSNKVAILVSDVLLITVILKLRQILEDNLSLKDEKKQELKKYTEQFTYELITKLIYSEKISKNINTEQDYINYATYKTANLFIYTITLSYILDNKDNIDNQKLEELKSFAKDYGLLFQKVDDTIDCEDKFQISGKDSKDKENNVNNYVYIMLEKNNYEQIKLNISNEIESLNNYKVSQNYKEEIQLLKRGLNGK